MSLDTLNNGDSGLEARTKINAAIAAVNGGTLLRATGTLQAFTNAGAGATPPPPLDINFLTNVGDVFSLTIMVDGVTKVIAMSDDGPSDYYADASTFSTANDYVAAFDEAMAYFGFSNVEKTADDGSGNIQYTNSSTGASANISGGSATTNGTGTISFSNGGAGTDLVPPSGDISEVVLVNAVAGKTIKLINAWFDGGISPGPTFSLYKRSSGGADTSISFEASMNTGGVIYPQGGNMSGWMNGLTPGSSLVAKVYETSVLPTDGSTCTVGVIYEQS